MRHKINIKISLLLAFLLIGSFATVNAQEPAAAMKGLVSDEFGRPLVGVVIRTENGRNATVTQKDGTYTLTPNDGSENIVFSYLGYADQMVPFQADRTVDVTMDADNHFQDEVINMGYSSQKRKDISGAVSSVRGEELTKTPGASLSQALTGRLSGLFMKEVNSESAREAAVGFSRSLASASASDLSKMVPLVVIDGVPSSYQAYQTYQTINPHEIESITLLKDASTAAMYGIQGANGVLVITTKRGTPGRTKVSASFDQSFAQATNSPRVYDSWEYATMRRQAAINDGKTGDAIPYTEDQIAKFKSGANRELYPNNNWQDMFIKDFSSQQRVNANVSGGNDNVRFFSSISYLHQGSQFKTENDDYKSNSNYHWFNYRTNVDVKLNKYLSGFVDLSGNITRERTPGNNPNWLNPIYQSILQMPSSVYGPVTPDGQVTTIQEIANPAYGILNRSGFTKNTVTNINSHVGLDLDMRFLTKGLKLSGLFAYQTYSDRYNFTMRNYERYVRSGNLDELNFAKKGDDANTALSVGREVTQYYHMDGNVHLDYARSFGKHSVTAMAYLFYQSLSQNYAYQNGSADNLNYKRLHTGYQATYGYDNRYLVKFDLGYSGSDQFARDRRFISTPSVSGAWVASNEAFLKNSKWLTLLKLRASYGKTANDILDSNRFSYLDDIRLNGGGALAELKYTIGEGLKGNPLFAAEVSKKQNYGIDLGLFNSLSISFDYYKTKMDNMLVSPVATIPEYQGVPLGYYPKQNIGKYNTNGFDLTVNYNKQINKDWSVYAMGMFSHMKNEIVYAQEASRGDNYVYPYRTEGFAAGQRFGYKTNGYFNSQSEIDNYTNAKGDNVTYSFGTPRPGDLKYVDLNNDGVISEADQVPLGKGFMPENIYSLTLGFTYRSWEFSCMFQGVGNYSTLEAGMGVYETSAAGVYGSRHANAWTPERYASGAEISAPALSMSTSTSHQPSDYYLYDRSYLRLKNVYLSYTLPKSVSRAISAEKIRIYLSGHNLVTWDNMKSDDYGPEGYYYSFPAYRIYNIGINVTF